MAYDFPPELKSLVDQNMALGVYSSEDHLLQAALHVLTDYHATVDDIRQGMSDRERGDFESLSDAVADIRQHLKAQQ